MELLLILLEGGMEFLGTPLWDSEDFLKLLIKGSFNLGIATSHYQEEYIKEIPLN